MIQPISLTLVKYAMGFLLGWLTFSREKNESLNMSVGPFNRPDETNYTKSTFFSRYHDESNIRVTISIIANVYFCITNNFVQVYYSNLPLYFFFSSLSFIHDDLLLFPPFFSKYYLRCIKKTCDHQSCCDWKLRRMNYYYVVLHTTVVGTLLTQFV